MNAKDFSVTEIVSENISPTGAREDAGILTVVLDPNTEKEKVLSKTVRKDDLFGIVIPDGYEMFSDEECTVPYVSDGNADSHVLIYSKKTVKCFPFGDQIRTKTAKNNIRDFFPNNI